MGTDRPDAEETRLRGRWLALTRLLWVGTFLLTLAVFCANLVVGNYGLAPTILLVIDTSVWFAVSLVLFWRKSTDRAVLLFSLQLVLTGGFLFPPLPNTLRTIGLWWIPVDALGLLAGVAITFVFAFPDGRFVPSFTRWLALGWIAASLVPVPIPGPVYPWNWWLSPLYTVVRVSFYVSLVLALVYRYRRRSTPVERQQIKWVVFAALILVAEVSLVNLVLDVLPTSFPALAVDPDLHHFVGAIAFYLVPLLLPLAIGVALL
jgi:hypothetical protein